MFAAFGYQPGFGPLAVAYGAANLASAIPLTSGGLVPWSRSPWASGPRRTAALAVLGYRIVNYWLRLVPGAVAYLRLRFSPETADRADHSDSTAR